MAENRLALVLGGGGAAGNAWLIGVLAGLAEAGSDLAALADVVIGTSAGATAAAQVRSGTPLAELLAAAVAPPPPMGAGRGSAPSRPMADIFERMRSISAAATSVVGLCRAMGAYGLESDVALGPDAAAQRRAQVAARLPRPDWPDKPIIVVAVEALTGEPALFDRNSGAALADAVAASTAMPGIAPTIAINGVHYIDGGVRSRENADLAAGYANVVVLSPYGGRTGPVAPGQFEGLRRLPEADLAAQVEVLRQQGSNVVVITPDTESRAAMGTNQMDLATRAPSARAGFAQGKAEAAVVRLV